MIFLFLDLSLILNLIDGIIIEMVIGDFLVIKAIIGGMNMESLKVRGLKNSNFKLMATVEFAIQKKTLNSGEVVHIPVCRRKSLIPLLSVPWERICRVYDNYILLDLDFEPNLSYEECEEHIRCYKQKLLGLVENQVSEIEFSDLERVDV